MSDKATVLISVLLYIQCEVLHIQNLMLFPLCAANLFEHLPEWPDQPAFPGAYPKPTYVHQCTIFYKDNMIEMQWCRRGGARVRALLAVT